MKAKEALLTRGGDLGNNFVGRKAVIIWDYNSHKLSLLTLIEKLLSSCNKELVMMRSIFRGYSQGKSQPLERRIAFSIRCL
jgi:hypothetical protein